MVNHLKKRGGMLREWGQTYWCVTQGPASATPTKGILRKKASVRLKACTEAARGKEILHRVHSSSTETIIELLAITTQLILADGTGKETDEVLSASAKRSFSASQDSSSIPDKLSLSTTVCQYSPLSFSLVLSVFFFSSRLCQGFRKFPSSHSFSIFPLKPSLSSLFSSPFSFIPVLARSSWLFWRVLSNFVCNMHILLHDQKTIGHDKTKTRSELAIQFRLRLKAFGASALFGAFNFSPPHVTVSVFYFSHYLFLNITSAFVLKPPV